MTRKKKNGTFWNILINLVLVIRSKLTNFNKVTYLGENKILIKYIWGNGKY